MNDDRPSDRVLEQWAHLSGRSKPLPIEQRQRGLSRPVALAAAAVVVVVVGVLVAVSLQHAPVGAVAPPGTTAPLVAGSPAATTPPGATIPSSPRPAVFAGSGDVQAGALLTSVDAWALHRNDVLLSHDGGESWTATTKPTNERVVGAAFADPLHGWVVSDLVPPTGSAGTLRVDVERTDDGGATWQSVEVTSIPSPGPNPVIAFPVMSVVAQDSVYLALQMSGDAEVNARLFATVDGGRSWQARADLPVPLVGALNFVDGSVGWAVAESGVLLRTSNGGVSWTAQKLPTVPGINGAALEVDGAPVRLADGSLILLVSAAKDGGRSAFLASHDQGTTWEFLAHGPDGAISVAYGDPRTWIVGDARSFSVSTDAGVTWRPVGVDLPGPVESIVAVDSTDLSAVVANMGRCRPPSDCYVPHELFATDDGGQTWRNITP